MTTEDVSAFAYYRATFNDVIADLDAGWSAGERMAAALDGFCEALVTTAMAQDKSVLPEGSYDYIPYSLQTFLRELFELDTLLAADPDYACRGLRYRPVKFLEIGCGAGRNLVVLKYSDALQWAELHGFDIQGALVKAGQRALGLQQELQIGDAMSFDYAPYDVVFSYRPFMKDALQEKFEAYLQKTMKVGAYLLAPLAMDAVPNKRMQPVGTSGHMWKKVA